MENLNLLSLRFREELGEKLFNEFNCFMTNYDRVNFVTERLQASGVFNNALQVTAKASEKSEEEAIVCKNKGNKMFQARQYIEAIQQYNKGISLAPHILPASSANQSGKNSEISILIANRSACLFHCGRYQSALCDIDCALRMGYPTNLKYKLMNRAGKCMVQMQQYSEANNQFKAALDVLKETNLETGMKEKWMRSLETEINTLSEIKGYKQQGRDRRVISGKSFDERNVNVEKILTSHLSDGVTIASSPEYGRYVAASKPIKAGTLIAKEAPFASILLPQFYTSHCYSCFSRIDVFFPCRHCNVVNYCSYQCEDKAWGAIHHLECAFMEYFKPDICARMGHLALNIYFEASCKSIGFLSCRHEAYNSVLSLVHHEELRDGRTNLHMTLMSYLLTEIAVASGPFDLKVCNKIICDRSDIMEILLKHLQIIQCNGFALAEMQNAESMQQSKPVDIGMALYPKCSYFNHACDPSIEFIYKGNELLAYALKDIEEGSQIYCDYGYVFYCNPRKERQDELRLQYFFSCSCVACVENWPLFDGLESECPVLKCPKCGRPCSSLDSKTAVCKRGACNERIDTSERLNILTSSYKEYKAAMQLTLEGRYEDALPVILQHMAVLQQLLCQPWKEYYSCHATAKQIFRLMGNAVN